MPPSLKLMRLNAKVKPGEYYYFMCRCKKPKAVQQKCKECGKTWEKKKELSKYEEKKPENESDNESDKESDKESGSAIGSGDNYRWYDGFYMSMEIDESHIIEYIDLRCDDCSDQAGYLYRHLGTETVYVVAYYNNNNNGSEEEGMWQHYPIEEEYDDCDDTCCLCDTGDDDNGPHLRVGRDRISGVYPSNYKHYSEDPMGAHVLQELI